MITNATEEQLSAALAAINSGYYDGNIRFKRFDRTGNRMNFTLTVNSSKGKGGRVSREGRRIAAACWHVHGNFFDALFAINPDAVVRSMGRKITREDGNWEDRNIGSQMYPFQYSESCKCD